MKCFEDLSASKQQAVLSIGTDPQCWNEALITAGMSCKKGPALSASCSRGTGVYKTSVVVWKKLSSKQQSGLKTCGYNQGSWDDGLKDPSACKKCFADLSHAQQQAALDIGTDQQCWDSASVLSCGGTSQKFDASFQAQPARLPASSKLPWVVFLGLLVSVIGLSGIRFAMTPAKLPGSDKEAPASPDDHEAHWPILQSGGSAYDPVAQGVELSAAGGVS